MGDRRRRPGRHRAASLAHPDLELVGCWVHGEAKAGKDVGTIVGVGAHRRDRDHSVDAMLALDADCVLYARSCRTPTRSRAILRSGKNVVTPLGWFCAERARSEPTMEAPALEGGVTLHGTGIDPGGITERFRCCFVGAVRRDHPRARRGVLRHPHLQRARRGPDIMGFGGTPGGGDAEHRC